MSSTDVTGYRALISKRCETIKLRNGLTDGIIYLFLFFYFLFCGDNFSSLPFEFHGIATDLRIHCHGQGNDVEKI